MFVQQSQLKLNLNKAINDESSKIQLLYDEFLNSINMYFMCGKNYKIKDLNLQKEVYLFSREVINGRGPKNLEGLKKKLNFLDETFSILNNPNLKTEHIEEILSKLFASDLLVEQVRTDLARMRHLEDAMKSFGKK